MQSLSDEADEIARTEQRASGHKVGVSAGSPLSKRSSAGLKSLPQTKWILAAAVLGVGAIVTVALVRRARSRRAWLAPNHEPSRWQNLAKAAGIWLFRMASRRIAQEVALRLTDAPATPPVPVAVPRPSTAQ